VPGATKSAPSGHTTVPPSSNVAALKADCFWAWAETLRLSACRVEELTELTQLSLRYYTLASTGKLVPLLHITPSKLDSERLIPMSPELVSVLLGGAPDPRQRQAGAPICALRPSREGARPAAPTSVRPPSWHPPAGSLVSLSAPSRTRSVPTSGGLSLHAPSGHAITMLLITGFTAWYSSRSVQPAPRLARLPCSASNWSRSSGAFTPWMDSTGWRRCSRRDTGAPSAARDQPQRYGGLAALLFGWP